jgi:type I restriction enzyme M protein
MSAHNDKMQTREQLENAIWEICNKLKAGKLAGALQYITELTWILFLRILDEREAREKEEAEILDIPFSPTLSAPYRWRDWAAPDGAKRRALTEGRPGAFYDFVRDDLFPHLKSLKNADGARQKIVSQIFINIQRPRVDTQRNLLDILDIADKKISAHNIDPTHTFPISQIYEKLILKMGERGGDGGQFFTPREVIRAMVKIINPQIGETILDPCCGTGGFLAQAFEGMIPQANRATQRETLAHDTFYGREKDDQIYPIALANLVLHGIDHPNLWHGNTLTKREDYGGLFADAPQFFDVVLTNPPFGGKENKDAQTRFAYKTGSTQALFVQEIIGALKKNGRCGVVLDEGFLFRTDEKAFVRIKRKLLDECDLYCVVSLPAGVFVNAGAGVKTNLLFFNKGRPTKRIWYYDLSGVKVTKKNPLEISRFAEFFRLLPKRADGENSWTVDFSKRKEQAAQDAKPHKDAAQKAQNAANAAARRLAQIQKQKPRDDRAAAELKQKIAALAKQAKQAGDRADKIKAQIYDLKAQNPRPRTPPDSRTPAQLIAAAAAQSRRINAALSRLQKM